VRKNFNARRKLHNAIDAVRALNKLREGGETKTRPVEIVPIDTKIVPEEVNEMTKVLSRTE
jgi:hypothetical protein